MLTLAGGGWVLVLVSLVCLALLAWAVAPALMRSFDRPPGDGKTLESYRFDLSNLTVPRELIVPAMLHRDMVPVLFSPTHSSRQTMQRTNDPRAGKYLVSDDLVIGVEVNGEARAYPLHIMNVHEIINDTLGDPAVPIAVTYHWPCDSVVVFDRRSDLGEGESHVAEFGVSGLVYNSNMLMYDRREPVQRSADQSIGSERLWSQLLACSISGSQQQALQTIPGALVRWQTWEAMHPETTVLDRDLRLAKRYKHAAPTRYFQSPELEFPVDPLPPGDSLPLKSRVIAVSAGGARRVYASDDIVNRATGGLWRDELGGVQIEFIIDPKARSAAIEPISPSDAAIDVIYAAWFAWHAMHPDDLLNRD